VVYLGHVMEVGDATTVLNASVFTRTRRRCSRPCLSLTRTAKQKPIRLGGRSPAPCTCRPAAGFHPRCPRCLGDICREQEPPWREGPGNHRIYCHIPLEELAGSRRRRWCSTPRSVPEWADSYCGASVHDHDGAALLNHHLLGDDDPARGRRQQILGRFATQEAKDNLRRELGLDRPVVVQYTSWLGDYVRGDWGESPSMNGEVRPVVFERLRNSLMLAAVAFAMYVPLGILLGLLAALRKNSWVDQTISVGSLAFIGLPEFVSGLILIAIFAIQLKWFPSQSSIPPDTSFVDAFPYLVPAGDHRRAD